MQKKVTNILQNSKISEKPIDMWYNRIRKEREVSAMKEYKFLVRVYYKNGTKEQRAWIETTRDAKEKAKKCREEANVTKVTLYRIDQTFEF